MRGIYFEFCGFIVVAWAVVIIVTLDECLLRLGTLLVSRRRRLNLRLLMGQSAVRNHPAVFHVDRRINKGALRLVVGLPDRRQGPRHHLALVDAFNDALVQEVASFALLGGASLAPDV